MCLLFVFAVLQCGSDCLGGYLCDCVIVFGVYSMAVTALGDTCVSVCVLFVYGVYSFAVTALGDTCVAV